MRPAEKKLFGLDGPRPAAGAERRAAPGMGLATYFFRVPQAYLPVLAHVSVREQQIGGSGASLEPPGPLS